MEWNYRTLDKAGPPTTDEEAKDLLSPEQHAVYVALRLQGADIEDAATQALSTKPSSPDKQQGPSGYYTHDGQWQWEL